MIDPTLKAHLIHVLYLANLTASRCPTWANRMASYEAMRDAMYHGAIPEQELEYPAR